MCHTAGSAALPPRGGAGERNRREVARCGRHRSATERLTVDIELVPLADARGRALGTAIMFRNCANAQRDFLTQSVWEARRCRVVQVWNRQAQDLWRLRYHETVGAHFLSLDSGLQPTSSNPYPRREPR